MAETAQLPLKLDSPLFGAVKGERNVMAFPWFDLDRRALKSRIAFEDSDLGVTIEVRAGGAGGCPTIYDKDLILYAATVIAKRADDNDFDGSDRDRTIDFTIHDFMRVASRSTDKNAYDNFHNMLDRLTTASIRTNIEVAVGDGEMEGLDGWFTWFESGTAVKYRRTKDGQKRVQRVRIVVGKWLWNAIVKDRKILTYDPRYFDLDPVARRLYDLARVHVGRQPRWQIGLAKLQRRIGDNRRLAKFADALLAIQERDSLPSYRFRVVMALRAGARRRSQRDLESTMVVFTPRSEAAAGTHGVDRQGTVLRGGTVSAVRQIEAVAREVRHPGLVRQMEAIGYMGRLAKAKAVTRALREADRPAVAERGLANDPVELADMLVELGLEIAD
ncbi:MAG: replication initiator protein A [Gammaproteobacteria bacterium]|uniref:replication initiator protein A n=1 Tax=Thalassobaculum sp. TaxID=2022740 RepID=UPI0032EC0073